MAPKVDPQKQADQLRGERASACSLVKRIKAWVDKYMSPASLEDPPSVFVLQRKLE